MDATSSTDSQKAVVKPVGAGKQVSYPADVLEQNQAGLKLKLDAKLEVGQALIVFLHVDMNSSLLMKRVTVSEVSPGQPVGWVVNTKFTTPTSSFPPSAGS